MKSKLAQMSEDTQFKNWLAEFKHQANYFVATSRGNEHAVQLCIAYAYEAGRSRQSEKETNGD